ncbi:MAG: hypothetical protein E5V61_19630 [Mesorhizobium sp.]|nr:MAG: hypothetical protein E5V61_19630 [Mesorhizobium sp.]TIX09708.1 MAG: hypothetical protein E5V46_21960 [Mesorhizobium sp.]TIX64119.1 MAG: hypothetical protein E5V30_29770 [Mesorhizobium sp.]
MAELIPSCLLQWHFYQARLLVFLKKPTIVEIMLEWVLAMGMEVRNVNRICQLITAYLYFRNQVDLSWISY